VPFTVLKNGKIYTNTYTVGHELQHCIDIAINLLKTKRKHANPDKAVSKEFYQ